jgi:hypothetical protein
MLEAMAAANAILRLKRKVCFILTIPFLPVELPKT